MMKISVRLSAAVVCLILTCGLATPSSHQATTAAARERWNKEFSGPLPNLNRNANALLVSAVKGRTPGRALDLGVGEGRNAIYLARNGWSVTGVDLSEVAVALAKQNAEANKAQLALHVADLDVFDFGKAQWDLIVSTYMHSWHDRSKTDLPARIHDALKPGGLLVMEAFAKPEVPFGFSVDELARAYSRFQILTNESVNEAADWDKDNKRHLVRFVAQKPSSTSPSATVQIQSKLTEPFMARVTDAASLKIEVENRLSRARDLLARLIDVKGPRTVDNTLKLYDELGEVLWGSSGLLLAVENLLGDSAMRDQAAALRPLLSDLLSEIGLRRDVYDALAGTEQSSVTDDVTQHYLDRELQAFRRGGVDRPEADRIRIRELRNELTLAQAEFQRNIRNGNRTVKTTAAELEGVPRDFLARQKPNADGSITLATDAINMRTVLDFAQSDDLRRRALTAWHNVAYPENGPVLQRMLSTRAELAKRLGFANWAAYDAASRMTRDSATVSAFIDKIAAASEGKARQEYAELLSRKRRDRPDANGVEEWETFYYAQLVRREQYDIDPQEVRQFFPADQVVAGVVDVASRLYGLSFRPVTLPVWHPSVRAFEMMEGGTMLGRFYFDLYPRPGKQASGASHLAARLGSGRQTPESVIMAALSGGDASGPGSMSHEEVRTLFHEFGHLVHSLTASRSAWHGVNGNFSERDAAEVPSMITEEWIWDARTLQTFAKHYKTGAPISDDLVARLRRSAEFGKGTRVRRQVAFSKLSLSLHDRQSPPMDVSATTREVLEAYLPFTIHPDRHFEAAFTHLGNPNYASTYYTYEWSNVIAKDLLTKFDRDNLLSTANAQRYREVVLAAGSSRPAADTFENFLGRPFSIAAWEKWLTEEAPVRPTQR